jgi:hypothetical protein
LKSLCVIKMVSWYTADCLDYYLSRLDKKG